MHDLPTKPELPKYRMSSPPSVTPDERSAVYRRVTSRQRDPLATLVEEVVTRHNDPRREP